MSSGDTRDARRGKEIQAAIGRVLLQRWDPLGAKNIAPDEYDAYIGPVYRLLSRGATPIQIAEYLTSVERDQMGLTAAPASALLGPAEALCRLRVVRGSSGERQLSCVCESLKDLSVFDMMADLDPAMAFFVEIARRGDPYWWLEASRCSKCGTTWLVGREERQNDVFVLRRLLPEESQRITRDAIWPADFDRYETLLRLGQAAGRSVRWVDPLRSSDLLNTIVDLARQRPGIRVSELASLLNIDFETAATIADQAVLSAGVSIVRDDEPWK